MLLRDYVVEPPVAMRDAYSGVPLSDVSCAARGMIIERAVRGVMEAMVDELSNVPEVGKRVNGHSLGRNQSSCDFVLSGVRYEVKSAQLKWACSRKRWVAAWTGIKWDRFDQLLLAMYTPSGIYIFRHDGVTGITTSGKSQESCGGSVQVFGPSNESSVFSATEVIVAKMQHMYITALSYDGLSCSPSCRCSRRDSIGREPRRPVERRGWSRPRPTDP